MRFTYFVLILFGFQILIGNVQTLPSDLYSKKAVGTLSGMAAKLAVAALFYLVLWLTQGGNYTSVFIKGASLAILAVWVLIPKVHPLKPKV